MFEALREILLDLFMELNAFAALRVSGAVKIVARTFFTIRVVASHVLTIGMRM